MYRGFIRVLAENSYLLWLKTMLVVRAVRVNQNNVAGMKNKIIKKRCYKAA